jgi:hypothetical protein
MDRTSLVNRELALSKPEGYGTSGSRGDEDAEEEFENQDLFDICSAGCGQAGRTDISRSKAKAQRRNHVSLLFKMRSSCNSS